jgi:hypothetical protein
MKKTLTLLTTLAGVLLLLAPVPTRAQEQVASLAKLKEQYQVLLAIERDPATTPEVRDVNRTFLEERRTQLKTALQNRLVALKKYMYATGEALSAAERSVIEKSIKELQDDLSNVGGERASEAAAYRPESERVANYSAASFDRPAEAVNPGARRAAQDSLQVTEGAGRTDPFRTKLNITVPPSVRRIKVVVVNQKGKTIYETLADLPRGGDKFTFENIPLEEGNNTVTVSDPDGSMSDSETITGGTAASITATSLTETARDRLHPYYDWGRVRGYFTGGVVFSKENAEFSKSDMGLSFVLDKNYIKRKGWNINTFFEARLSSIPVSTVADPATDDDDGGGGNGGNGGNDTDDTNDTTDPLDTFISSRKAALVQVGVYAPINVTAWKHERLTNTLFIAPIAKGGIQTITSNQTSAEATILGDDDVFNFFSLGVRFGHYKYPRPRGFETEADLAPELISWLDITTGRWENFELQIPTGQNDQSGNPIKTRQRRWRYQAEGRLRIPETPFLVGFDGNFGDGPDDVRFGFGIRFDVGRIISKLKIFEVPEVPATGGGGGN